MESLIYYTILNLPSNADMIDIKKAYYKLAKENHPDHFSEEYREIQELKMMQINEAYHNLIELCNIRGKISNNNADKKKDYNYVRYDFVWNEHIKNRYKNLSPIREVGEHRDPAYVYYKQGFVNFSKGLHGIMSKSPKKYRIDAGSIIEWANNSIYHFQLAHNYFSRVVSEYPESIWSIDAEEKLRRIKNFNALYIKILHNIKSRLKKRRFFDE